MIGSRIIGYRFSKERLRQRPTPPFWGTKILKDEIALEDLFWHMDLQALIAGQWQFRKPKDQTREEYVPAWSHSVYIRVKRFQGDYSKYQTHK